MINKRDRDAIIKILNKKRTYAVAFFSHNNIMDSSYVANEDDCDCVWDTIEMFLSLFMGEFENKENSMLLFTRFFKQLGYEPTQQQVTDTYIKFLNLRNGIKETGDQ